MSGVRLCQGFPLYNEQQIAFREEASYTAFLKIGLIAQYVPLHSPETSA